jgi:ankyrin repeat protein
VVWILLDKGADVNAQGGVYSNALQAASCRGHKEVVRMLLDKGAVKDFEEGGPPEMPLWRAVGRR